MFGNPETTTGGLALKFYATMRFDIRRIAAIMKEEAVVGSRTRVKVVKNKVAPPFREAEFDLIYGKGISRAGELVDIGTEQGVFSKSGTWYTFGDMRIGQGRDAAVDFLSENAPIMANAETQLYYFFAKPHITCPIAQPNLVAGREVVPEFLLVTNSGRAVARAAQRLLDDEGARAAQRREFGSIRERLLMGRKPSEVAADVVLSYACAQGGSGAR